MSTKVQYHPSTARPVLPVEPLEDYQGITASLSGSQTLAALGVTLHENVQAVTINPAGAINYSPDGGTADATNFPLATNQAYTIYGTPAKLADVRLYAASATNVGIIQHILRQNV